MHNCFIRLSCVISKIPVQICLVVQNLICLDPMTAPGKLKSAFCSSNKSKHDTWLDSYDHLNHCCLFPSTKWNGQSFLPVTPRLIPTWPTTFNTSTKKLSIDIYLHPTDSLDQWCHSYPSVQDKSRSTWRRQEPNELFKARCTVIFSKKSWEKAPKRRINYCENQEISILTI